MGVVSHYDEVKGKAVYYVTFQLGQVNFSHASVKGNAGHYLDAPKALEIARRLAEFGIKPNIERQVVYDALRGSIVPNEHLPENTSVQRISMADLESRVRRGDPVQPASVPYVVSTINM